MLSDWIRDKAAANGDRVAIEHIAHGTRTYAALDKNANSLAAGYAALGLTAGTHAARLMANSLENVDSWFGMIRAGVVEVPINTGNVGMSLQHAIDQSDSRAIVLDEQFLERLSLIAGKLPKLEHVIVNRSTSGALPVQLPSRFAVHDLADLYLAEQPPEVALDGTSIASIIYTSGTTGPSKGVVAEHEFMDTLNKWCSRLMRYGPEDTIFTFFPLFHLMARNCGVCAAIESDAKLVIGDHFSASTFWDTCREYNVSAFTYIGDMGLMLTRQPPRDDDADNPVTRGFGAGMPHDLWADFEARFGVQLTEIYGMTELGGALQNSQEAKRMGSIGKPAQHFDVRIHDENDLPVSAGVPGEIVVRPKRPHAMFREYYNMPEQTLDAFRNLWFHTGDRARQDDDGFFYFVDRAKDTIRRRGENISSSEVEQVMRAHPSVADVAAYGVVIDDMEEVMISVVAADPAEPPGPAELVEFAGANLPRFAVPRFIRFVDQLPRNASQRILKFELRETGITQDTWERVADKSASSGYILRQGYNVAAKANQTTTSPATSALAPQ